MATGDITTAPIGTTIPLAYGPVRATGKKLIDFTASDKTIIQAYGLAEGEWDGCDAIFVNNILAGLVSGTVTNSITVAAGSSDGSLQNWDGSATANLHFHSGSDTPVGSPFVGSSVGTDFSGILHVSNQLLDEMWSLIPTVVNPLFFSRLAYYFISYKPISTTTSAALSVIGDWRTTKCRIFDADGNQTDYRYTDNPAWHLADSWLRRVVKPEYAILPVVGADHLSSTERACFDWESYVEAANYFDEVLANGKKRFRGAYAFASSTTLAAIHEQILLCCRSYQQEYAGKLSLMCDKPRPSTFLLGSNHLIPGSITIDSQEIHANPNRFIAQFLDLELPAISTIASIQASISGTETDVDILTTQPNPVAKGDFIAVAGVTDSSFDAYYFVNNVDTAGIITAQFFGVTVPTGSSTGGAIGYLQTRFSTRAPELNHRQAQKAGALLVSSSAENATRLNKKKVQYDFASCTYDQQNRLLKYELLRSLGPDQSPWNPPITVTLSARSESIDSSMRALKAQLPGDVITLDDSVFFEFAGDYEIIERDPSFFNWQQSPDGTASADQNAGTILLKLRSFNQNAFPDVSDAPSASYAVLPGNELSNDFAIAPANYEIGYTSLTATDTGTDITLSIVGLLARINSATLTYADCNITGLPYDTYGYLFVNDPTFVGGTKTLSWTTNEQAGNIPPGVLFIANLTTPPAPTSSGGSGGGGGTGGSGGGTGSGGGSGTGAGGSGGGGGGRQLPP